MTYVELAVRLRAVARAIESAERVGPPEARLIQVSESMAVERIIPAIDEATLHVLGLPDVEHSANR